LRQISVLSWYAAVGLFALGCHTAARAAPDAVVTNIRGQVHIVRAGGERVQATAATPVEAGDEVRTGPNGSATLYYPQRAPVALEGGKSVTVGADAEPVHRQGAFARAWSALLSALKQGFGGQHVSRPAATRGGADGFAPPHAVAPRCSRIVESRPTFRWTPAEGAARYTVKVGFYDDLQDIWRSECPRAPLTYPESAPAFEAERKYFWEVTAHVGAARIRSDPVWFSVLDEGQRQQLQSTLNELQQSGLDMGGDLSVACVYLDYEVLDQAAAIMERASSRNPDDPTSHVLLADVYERMDLSIQAEKARRRAEAVSEAQRAVWREVER
jgi:hypothetical protein